MSAASPVLSSEAIAVFEGDDFHCPYGAVTRGQLAAFVIRAFGLRLYEP